MKTTMTYNRKAIMTRAWAVYNIKLAMVQSVNAAAKRLTFKSALLQAWMEAKSPAPTKTPADKIRAAITMLENKSFRYDISADRAKLQSQLMELAA